MEYFNNSFTKSRFNWYMVRIFVYRMGQEIGGKNFAITSSRFESLSHPSISLPYTDKLKFFAYF
jgi:hypothetical protein